MASSLLCRKFHHSKHIHNSLHHYSLRQSPSQSIITQPQLPTPTAQKSTNHQNLSVTITVLTHYPRQLLCLTTPTHHQFKPTTGLPQSHRSQIHHRELHQAIMVSIRAQTHKPNQQQPANQLIPEIPINQSSHLPTSTVGFPICSTQSSAPMAAMPLHQSDVVNPDSASPPTNPSQQQLLRHDLSSPSLPSENAGSRHQSPTGLSLSPKPQSPGHQNQIRRLNQ